MHIQFNSAVSTITRHQTAMASVSMNQLSAFVYIASLARVVLTFM